MNARKLVVDTNEKYLDLVVVSRSNTVPAPPYHCDPKHLAAYLACDGIWRVHRLTAGHMQTLTDHLPPPLTVVFTNSGAEEVEGYDLAQRVTGRTVSYPFIILTRSTRCTQCDGYDLINAFRPCSRHTSETIFPVPGFHAEATRA